MQINNSSRTFKLKKNSLQSLGQPKNNLRRSLLPGKSSKNITSLRVSGSQKLAKNKSSTKALADTTKLAPSIHSLNIEKKIKDHDLSQPSFTNELELFKSLNQANNKSQTLTLKIPANKDKSESYRLAFKQKKYTDTDSVVRLEQVQGKNFRRKYDGQSRITEDSFKLGNLGTVKVNWFYPDNTAQKFKIAQTLKAQNIDRADLNSDIDYTKLNQRIAEAKIEHNEVNKSFKDYLNESKDILKSLDEARANLNQSELDEINQQIEFDRLMDLSQKYEDQLIKFASDHKLDMDLSLLNLKRPNQPDLEPSVLRERELNRVSDRIKIISYSLNEAFDRFNKNLLDPESTLNNIYGKYTISELEKLQQQSGLLEFQSDKQLQEKYPDLFNLLEQVNFNLADKDLHKNFTRQQVSLPDGRIFNFYPDEADGVVRSLQMPSGVKTNINGATPVAGSTEKVFIKDDTTGDTLKLDRGFLTLSSKSSDGKDLENTYLTPNGVRMQTYADEKVNAKDSFILPTSRRINNVNRKFLEAQRKAGKANIMLNAKIATIFSNDGNLNQYTKDGKEQLQAKSAGEVKGYLYHPEMNTKSHKVLVDLKDVA
jgi:hypothetical protein